jgi:hypothetical protein
MMTWSVCAPPGMGGGSRKDEMTEIYGVEKCREATVVQGPTARNRIQSA